jgi:pyruvate/2-oxoglutarate/acetoin dehydrogenase E1 component
MSDVAGAGIAAGAGIVGRRPILVIRFQDFMFLNSSMLVNFAAKRKEIFGKGCPVFIRALATEGPGIGPVHSSVTHNMFMNMPGFKVVSEHRKSFNQIEEMKNIIEPDAEITLFGISTARFNVLEAVEKLKKEGIKCNVINLYWLKPLKLDENILNPLIKTKIGLVVDPGFEICGASQSIAYELMKKSLGGRR